MVVFFDIDDTLVDSESAHLKAIKEIYLQFSKTKNNISQIESEWLIITNRYLKLYFEGKITLDQQRIMRITEFWKSKGQPIEEKQAGIIYRRYHQLFLRACIPFSDVIPVLAILRARRYKLGIISNGACSDQLFKLRNNELINYFDDIIISEKVGYSKPDKDIFQLAARETGETTSSCIYIGDSFDLDYVGSLNSGMKAIWLDRKNSNANNNCEKIRSLNELENHVYFSKISG